MRKCPNCKKPVPVGARRCVYCRVLIGESSETDSNSTRMGVGGQDYAGSEDEVARNNSTSFGHPGGGGRSDYDMSERNSRQFDEMPHQTMLGLGPIGGSSSRAMGGRNDIMDSAPQHTIAGMPGLSFDNPGMVTRGSSESLQPLGSGSFSSGSSSGGQMPVRAPSISGNNFQSVQSSRFLNQDFERGMLASSVRSSQNFEPIPSDMMPGANSPAHSYASSVNNRSVSRNSAENIIPVSSEPVIPAPEEPVEDLLAGLPGVVPSSLVDEEFVDLTSKLFGDDFAAVNDPIDDEDDDGLDFDLLGEYPEPTPIEAPKPEAKKEEPAPVAAAKSEDKKSEDKKSEDKSDDKKSEDKKSDKSPAKKSAKKSDAKKKKKPTALDHVALGTSAVAAFFIIIWLLSSLDAISAAIVSAIIAVLNLVADIGFFKLRTKLKAPVMTGIMFGGAILLFVGMALIPNDAGIDTKLLLLAILFQIISAACCFLKKS